MKTKYILILFAIFLFSCDKDSYTYIDKEIKNFADFHEGSYWVYHNDSMNVYDTIKVYKRDQYLLRGRLHDNRESFDYDENIIIYYKSSYDTTIEIRDYLYSGFVSRSVYKYQKNDTLNWHDYELTYQNNKYYDIGAPFYSGAPINTDTSFYLYNFINQGIKYNTVLYYKANSNISKIINSNKVENISKITIELFFSLDKGIIQKIYTDSLKQVKWYLIDSKIVK